MRSEVEVMEGEEVTAMSRRVQWLEVRDGHTASR